jgi:acyl CoA:acetate/3-ketoacid CoA transferase
MLVRTQILFPKEVYDQIKLEAALKSTSMSKIVTKAVVGTTGKKKISGQEAIRQMIKHAYRGKKAPKDLSTNDDYLYGKKARYGLY